MPKEILEENKKMHELIDFLFKIDSNEYSFLDLKKELYDKDIWVNDITIRRYISKLEKKGKIIHRKEGKTFIYKQNLKINQNSNKINNNYEDVEEFEILKEEQKKRHNQLGAIINMLKETKSKVDNFKVKERILGNLKNKPY